MRRVGSQTLGSGGVVGRLHSYPLGLHELDLLPDKVVHRLRQDFVQVGFCQTLQLNTDW